jgi:hypothetical protein
MRIAASCRFKSDMAALWTFLRRQLTNTDHGCAALPQDAADVGEVEADQPVDHQQIRD